MSRKSAPPVVPGKIYRVTFGVNQTEKINRAANKLNMSPRQFLHQATMEACENLDPLSER